MTEPAQDLETRKEAEAVGGASKYWQMQLELADQDHRDWLKDGKEVVDRYKGKRSKSKADNKRFNILFSNTETLKAALFARMAKPDIRRRFADRDPVGKQIAEIVERSAIYCDDAYNSERSFDAGVEDYLLPGRGIVRVEYEAQMAKGEDQKEYVSEQTLSDKYVPWDEFRHEPAKKWERVSWIAFRHLMSRDDLAANFEGLGEAKIKSIPLAWSPKADDDKLPDAFKRAEVWEIWDKTERKRVWIVKQFAEVLRTDDDPYGLEQFFPIAEPLQAVATNDTYIPVPEFHLYRDQADGLDEVEARIDRLTRALKRRGVYDATFKELSQLAKAADNQFVPVKNYADLSSKGGLAAAFQAEDIASIAKVLAELHSQRDLRVQTIYEVVGIADIMRGSSDPRETLGAQKIKAQFGGNRLKKRQDKVQKWIRDTLRLKAEIIAEHFEPQKLAEMTGFNYMDEAALFQEQQQAMAKMPPPQPGQPPAQPPPPTVEGRITPDMIKVMRDDKLRSYRIDIETDSTIFEDAEAEKQAVTEMMKGASEFVAAWVPVLEAQPAMLELAFEMLAFALRRFKMGRSLEEVLEQTKMKLQQAAQQPKPPDPKVQAEQAKAQAAQQKAQMDIQVAQQKAQIEMEKMKAQLQMQQAEMQMMQQKMGLEMQMEHQKMAIEQQRGEQEMAMDQQRMAMEGESMERQAEMDERSAERAEHADTRKHEMGLEVMAAKAKQAKQKPRPNA
jgi:hypothetical protein